MPKERSQTVARLVAFLNIAIVIFGILFYIPAFSYNDKHIQEVVASGDIERVGRLAIHINEGNHAYGGFFLICFLLMLISSMFLWNKPRSKTT